jgi:hypothetical protein
VIPVTVAKQLLIGIKQKKSRGVMKFRENIKLGSLVRTLSRFGGSVSAATPDGQTPAQEGVCDVLTADGVTKDLSGLCVAICEAQDFAEVSSPITEEDIDLFFAKAPSGKIIAQYDKPRAVEDPAMPCIVPQEVSAHCSLLKTKR